MAQTNVLKKYLDAGVAFTSMTQSKAEELVKELVKAGEVQTEERVDPLPDGATGWHTIRLLVQ